MERLQEQDTQQLVRRGRGPAVMRIGLAKAMPQLLQALANELAYLAQRMIRRNPLLRPNVREKAALILEPSGYGSAPSRPRERACVSRAADDPPDLLASSQHSARLSKKLP